MNLLRLPIEIIVDILLCLDVSDAYAVQALNHFFRNLYKTSLILQYALECKIAHVRDNPNCHLPIPERLQILRERESAWSSLTPTSKRITALPAGPGKCISNTRRLKIQPNHCTLFEYSKVSQLAFRKYFQISSIREIKEDSFHPIPLGIGNLMHVGFCVDEHDLIACLTKNSLPDSQIELRLVLLQYSTGKAHPLAMEPNILVFRNDVSNNCYNFMANNIEIFGENLVLTIRLLKAGVEVECMYVYNWKTGQAKCEPIPVSNCDVVVLDQNLVIVPDPKEWSLYIFYIPSSSSGGPVKLIQQLDLPPCHVGRSSFISCRSLPNPTEDGRFPKYISSSIPFMDKPDTALICITLLATASLLVHRDSIMRLLPPSEEWSAVTKHLILDWDSWGPPVTAIQRRVTSTYGQRSLYVSEFGLRCCDFNKHHVRRSTEVKLPDLYEPFMINDVNLITTRLPCVEIVSPSKEFSGKYLADGAVVGMKVRPFLTD
ncbi:hypothetical protein AGABI2DRAFT_120826 [Agaricus bisporus var. bisporus H97]|uniref:hypothetical protein n=1 Tax=Agaricus bisporus var. bisporus (strain H97 / ATCC MYA-4626 / FGSC 10389) TaxID=936046 RepID=UPI00029F6153|nr:hypothetical protein AGABI2DRAFT_120826 [Agaricus bisporus var. bisporus H97]EKV44703.1 hypothetical protein AGABI2DRAFT_120826 [Agaricus bisporus var. bisporus H97]